MPNYHTYLISSLPALHFGAKPPFSFERFLEKCGDLIPEKEVRLIRAILEQKDEFHDGMKQGALKKIWEFNMILRNELTKIRAGRKKIDPAPYLRQDGYAWPYVIHTALNASRNPSLIESERMLDIARWDFLNELALGHYFDIEVLIIYASKLVILKKWEDIENADKEKLLKGILEKKAS